MYIDLFNNEPQNANEYIDYLMAISYSREKDNLNLKELGYIELLRGQALSPEKLVNVLSNDIKSTEKSIAKLLNSNPNYPTEGYEQKRQMIIALKLQLEEKIKTHIKSNDSVSTQKLGEETLQEQNVSEIARTIIAILFRDYWATEQQHRKIVAFQNAEREKYKQELYNPDNLFKKSQKYEEVEENIQNKNMAMVEYKEPIMKRIFNKILRILHLKQ